MSKADKILLKLGYKKGSWFEHYQDYFMTDDEGYRHILYINKKEWSFTHMRDDEHQQAANVSLELLNAIGSKLLELGKEEDEQISRAAKFILMSWREDKRSKSIENIQELVDKETPMKPIKIENYHYVNYLCRYCGSYVLLDGEYNGYNRCDDCGQRIDWVDE